MTINNLSVGTPLSREEVAEARQRWIDLMFATSVGELEAARQSLCHAAPRIQSSIMSAFVAWTCEAKELTLDQTPFDEGD